MGSKPYKCGCVQENPDFCPKCKQRVLVRARRKANPGGRKEESKKYLEKYGDRIRARDREKYARNPEPRNEACRKHYRKDPSKHVKRVSKWQKENPEKMESHYIKYGRYKRTGHTVEYYNAMWEAQNGCCAICEKSFTKTGATRPVADHNHNTGRPRAVLCVVCNGGLGWIEHPLMGKMLEYLEEWSAKHTMVNNSDEAVELQ